MIGYILVGAFVFLFTYLAFGPNDLGTKLNKLYRMYHGEKIKVLFVGTTDFTFVGIKRSMRMLTDNSDYVLLRGPGNITARYYLDDIQDHPSIGLFVLGEFAKEVDEQ